MLTKNEITSLSLSPTKKDFAQIWNELLEVASKLSERWDPTSTNESDPGIVILKALAGIADKLNYNIDKNTLEAFMPTAAQEDSMRKLCEMLGYNVKYYQSAVTEVTIKYHNSDPSEDEATVMANGLIIPKFATVTNNDQDINYFIIPDVNHPVPAFIAAEDPIKTFKCMEGQLIKCESINDNGVITANQISENNRFYLPESLVAENGIFIYNIFNSSITGTDVSLEDGIPWEKVDNLNIYHEESRVYKFGFDSYEGRPYIEFPENYAELFNDGIFIYYTRTSGAAGNVSARVLTRFNLPSTGDWGKVSSESFSVENIFAATSGANTETIKQAYNNYKKTIGTFETLVTCRDYMNKIYSMVNAFGKPLVSNILVTDIRSDLNRAVTICSCDRAGIFYKETPLYLGEKPVGDPIVEPGSYVENLSNTGEWLSVGEPEEGEWSEWTRNAESTETIQGTPEIVSDTTKTATYTSEVNKPIFNDSNKTWYIGNTNSLVFDPQTCISGTNWDNFNTIEPGTVSKVSSGVTDTTSAFYGKKVWQIKQGTNTKFKTNLIAEEFEYTYGEVETNTTTTQKERYERERTNTLKQERDITVYKVKTDTVKQPVVEKYAIDHFDLVLYPFKSYSQIKGTVQDLRKVYDSSFTYSPKTFDTIDQEFKDSDIKTIAHNLRKPEGRQTDEDGNVISIGDIVSINNYLRLDATIATNTKIMAEEGAIIKDKIKVALANAFNMRELDFSEEIPFDSIVEVIENADSRIRLAALNEPSLYTTFSVFDSLDSSKNPIIKEYAIESDWLTLEEAEKTNRFDMDKYDRENERTLSTFNSKEAREIYNKLALRNVLAGRVPLFSYNNTFKHSFSESAYQTSTLIPSIPEGINLPAPSNDEPFTMITTDNGKTYTGRLVELSSKPDGLEEPDSTNTETSYANEDLVVTYLGKWQDGNIKYYELAYAEVAIPELADSQEVITDNVIKTVNNNAITDIETTCEIIADDNNTISDFTLESGEFIRFRAPNFTTIKTYPAYVNYHLELNKEAVTEAEYAEAETLFDLLDKDRDAWCLENPVNNWQRVLNHFKDSSFKKVVKQTQNISGFSAAAAMPSDLCSSTANPSGTHVDGGDGKCSYCHASLLKPIQVGEIVVKIDETVSSASDGIATLLNQSGCLRFTDNHNITYNSETKLYEVKALVTWQDAAKAGVPDLDLRVSLSSPFITDSVIITRIKDAIQTRLDEMVNQVRADGSSVLPKEAWTITFEYECVPLTPSSLDTWQTFIKANAIELFKKKPLIESDTILWRAFGEGYNAGKYVQQDTSKLLKFDSNYFGTLPANYLKGLYLIWKPGKDAQAAVIANNEEYKLQANEYLYIEYTPASTSESSTTPEAVTEILGPGTIIRPNGFTAGLMDSSMYFKQGNSYHKTVLFETESGASKSVEMHRFGANEQVEIRDFAKVELTRDSFGSGSSTINYYKNFNGCPELEDIDRKGTRTYTLKDGEYFFYTDANKAELAYFSTGTQITLSSGIYLDEFEIIELNTIFDTGLADIPWKPLGLTSTKDKIVFQEYQYITLGANDTIKTLKLTGNTETGDSVDAGRLSDNWQYCDEVTYSLAGSEDVIKLSNINVYGDRLYAKKGCGWEVSSILELNASSNIEQILRINNQIKTGLKLTSTSPINLDDGISTLEIEPIDEAHPLAFKTNLNCQIGSSHINIDNVYSNPKKLKGFEFKVFTKELPAIVKTLPGRVCPYDKQIKDITNWPGEVINIPDQNNSWTEINLDKIKVQGATNPVYDSALRLPISVLAETYGVFSIYLEYSSLSEDTNVPAGKTWIEVVPGTPTDAITLFNVNDSEVVWETSEGLATPNKLLLKPGINCIKVNKTTKLFVKTSDTSNGVLLFDNLKLVNCLPIEYQNPAAPDGAPLHANTYGLNITQLGYLNVNDVTSLDDITLDKIVDEDTKNTLIEGCFDKTKDTLKTLYSEKEADYRTKSAELLEVKPKLQKVINLAKKIEDDLTKLKASMDIDEAYVASYEALFEKYDELTKELDKEQVLLEAINADTGVSALETLFNSVLKDATANISESQLKLLEELENLQVKALAEISTLNKDIVLNHFDNIVSNQLDSIKDTITEPLKRASRSLVEADYLQQMLPISTKIEQVVNAEERAKLQSLFTQLKDSAAANEVAELQAILRQLITITNKSALDELLESLLAAITNASEDEAGRYSRIYQILSQLRIYLNNNEFVSLLSELNSAIINKSDDSYISELSDRISVLAEAPHKYDQDIEGYLEVVLGVANGDTTNTDLLDDLHQLCTNLYTDFKSTLAELLDDISDKITQLNKIKNPYTSSLTALRESKDAATLPIIAELTELTKIREEKLLTIDSFDATKVSDYQELPFGRDAAYVAWKKYLESTLPDKVKALRNDIAENIITLPENVDISDDLISDLSLLKDSQTSFKVLIKELSKLAQKNLRNKTQKDFVSDLVLPGSAELSEALSNLPKQCPDIGNATVYRLVSDYLATSRPDIIKELKDELSDSIKAKKQLLNTFTEILCPHLLEITKELPEMFVNEKLIERDVDPKSFDLFKPWLDTLNSYITTLCAAAKANSIKEVLPSVVFSITTLTTTGFEATLLEAIKQDEVKIWFRDTYTTEKPETLLLPGSFTDLLSVLCDIIKVQDKCESFYNTDFKGFTLDAWLSENEITLEDADIGSSLTELDANLNYLNRIYTVYNAQIESKDYEKYKKLKQACNYIAAERQLLEDLRAIDRNRDFYYTAPEDLSIAIDFNEDSAILNTLANPRTNYDINNVNNTFVISKLDIDYLDRGLQIARSSRLN